MMLKLSSFSVFKKPYFVVHVALPCSVNSQVNISRFASSIRLSLSKSNFNLTPIYVSSPFVFKPKQTQISILNNFKSDYDFYSHRFFSSSAHQEKEQENGGSKVIQERKKKTKNTALIILSMIFGFVGLGYSFVPLYRIFCQISGYGGTVQVGKKVSDLANEDKTDLNKYPIVVHFTADINAAMRWKFEPCQESVTVIPGESTLVFYKAKNPTNEPIIGVSTYNVTPAKVGTYFNKIQCFCFEEQCLEPGEEVELPVFFFIDPEMVRDPKTKDVTDMVLSYTFFKAK